MAVKKGKYELKGLPPVNQTPQEEIKTLRGKLATMANQPEANAEAMKAIKARIAELEAEER